MATKREYLSIQEAADLSQKSLQTIRRAIKSGKLKSKKRKTPQGFHYMIDKLSLCELYGVRLEVPKEAVAPKKEAKKIEPKQKIPVEAKDQAKVEKVEEEEYVNNADFKRLTALLEKMVNQHSEERRNFVKLVNTLQEKIFILENQVNLLQTPVAEKKWFQFWK